MPRFEYQAIDDYGRQVRGTLIAQDENGLRDSLSGIFLHLLSAKERGERARSSPLFRQKVKRGELTQFTFLLRTLVASGVPLVTALDDLGQQTEDAVLKEVVADIRCNVQSGANLSDSFALHPGVFADLYVSVIRAGETTGNLEAALADLVKFLTWQEDLAGQIRQATFYPATVLCTVTGLIFVLFTFVFPRFLEVFKASRVELPLPTRVVIAMSEFFRDHGLLVLAALAATAIGLHVYRSTAPGRLRTDGWKLRIPVVGNLLRALEVTQFCHFLASLFRAGVEMTHSLSIVERLVGNRVITGAVRHAREEILAGSSLSTSLRKSGAFPPIVLRMISVGESTGHLDETLENVSQYYDREIPRVIKKTFAVMEPLVTLLLGVVVFGAAISFFLALYKMVGTMGSQR
jgi:type IV pilus assembly protein PilC